jgi:DNA-binding response OmpR family regulator
MGVHFCPHCARNITPDEPVEIGRWRVSPWAVIRDGKELEQLTVGERIVLHTLAASEGKFVTGATLGRRASTRLHNEGDPADVAQVLVCRIRSKLGEDSPIRTVWGHGYKWGEAL